MRRTEGFLKKGEDKGGGFKFLEGWISIESWPHFSLSLSIFPSAPFSNKGDRCVGPIYIGDPQERKRNYFRKAQNNFVGEPVAGLFYQLLVCPLELLTAVREESQLCCVPLDLKGADRDEARVISMVISPVVNFCLLASYMATSTFQCLNLLESQYIFLFL